MKKYFKFAMAAIALVASVSFFACSNDDDEPEAPTEKTVKEATILTGLYVNKAMLDTYDIVCTVLGQELSFSATPVDMVVGGETVPMYAMELEGSSNAVPLISIMNVKFTIKDGYQVPDKSDFALATIAKGTITYTNGDTDDYAATGYSQYNKGVMGDKIDGYTESINKNYGRLKATLSTDGITLDTSAE